MFCLRAAWAVRAEKKERREMTRVAFWGAAAVGNVVTVLPGENDEGGAVLSGFAANIGTVLILR